MMPMWFCANGSHQPASRITHLCAVIQYWVRSSVVHSIHLAAGGHKDYVPFRSHGTDHDDIMISEEDDEGVVSKCVNRFPISSPHNSFHFCRVLDDLCIYISLPSISSKHLTPFTQIKQFWFVAENAARNEWTHVQLTWAPCKTKFEYSRLGMVSAPISISDLHQLVHKNQQILTSAFESLLPSTASIPTIQCLPWATMKDEATSDTSFLDNTDDWNCCNFDLFSGPVLCMA